MCLPGVGVQLTRGGRGEEEERGERGREDILCELQVDWMYAQVHTVHTYTNEPRAFPTSKQRAFLLSGLPMYNTQQLLISCPNIRGGPVLCVHTLIAEPYTVCVVGPVS